MAYIDQTVLLDYQHQGVAEQERFATRFGLRAAIMQETPKLSFLTPRLKQYLRSVQGRTVRLPAIKKDSITVATVMSYNIPLNLPETDYSTLTLITIMATFGLYPEDFQNQQVAYDEVKRNRIREVDEAMALAFEAYVITHLSTYKTKVWNGAESTMGFTFDGVNYVLNVGNDAQMDDSMFANIQTQAAYNNWNADGSVFISNPLAGFIYNRMMQKGAANEKNLMWQTLPQRFESLRVTNDSGKLWTGYLVESGSIGVAPNFTLPFRISKDVFGGQFDISAGKMPMLGDQVGLYEELGLKATSVNGNMSWVDKYAFTYSFFLLKKYNSDYTNTVSNILKINGNKT